MRIAKDESGQMLIITSLCLTAMFGLLALSTDVGLLFRAKRNLQIAADAAATAGALDYYYNSSLDTAKSAAKAASATNGFTDGTNGTVVSVSTPPADGPNKGTTGFVEVVVSEPNPTIFLRMFNFSSVTVAARAVAGAPGYSQACVYVLNPTASLAMDLEGSFDVSANHCGVLVDSNSSTALQFTGGSGSLTAGSVSVVGGDGGQTGDSTPTPVTGVAPANDPLSISGPIPPGGCTLTSSSTSLTGSFAGPGAGNSICFTNAVSLSNVTLGQGIYVFENGVTTSGNITSGSGGTTLDVYSGSLSMNTGTVFNLVAPTSGSTNGIVIMEPSTNSNTITIQKGNVTGSVTGIIYAPSAQLYLQDSGGDTSGGITLTTDLIVNTLFDKTATLTLNSYSAANSSTTPLRSVALVE